MNFLFIQLSLSNPTGKAAAEGGGIERHIALFNFPLVTKKQTTTKKFLGMGRQYTLMKR